ncbi:MAG TPA: hypothetical protein VK705_10145, partial [Ferruginibacter sp.]|nr:hypothetical protein [Ferruginibacter sp.]
SKRQLTDNKQINTNQPIIDKKGIDNNNQQNDKDLLNTNDQVSNKEVITDNKVNNSARSTNINNTKPEQYNNDQTQLTTTNKQLNNHEQTINDNDTKTSRENNKEQVASNNNVTNIDKKINNNISKNSYDNSKDELTAIKENSNKTEAIHPNKINKDNIGDKKATGQNADNKSIHTKKLSSKIIENKTDKTNTNDDLVSNNQSLQNETSISKNHPIISVSASNRNKTKHNITVRSNTKRSVQKNDVAGDNETSENNTETTTAAPSDNNSNTVKANNNLVTRSRANTKRSLKNNNTATNNNIPGNNTNALVTSSSSDNISATHNHTKSTYYKYSIASVSTKNNKVHSKKGNNIGASTKSKTQFNIASSTPESNEENIDTAQLIKIGQYVLANKKAKHHIIKKDTSTIKPLVLTTKDSSTTAKKKDNNKKQLRISAGIAEQQAIRLNCDCVYPNDAYTTSSLVTDYIPSVYIRIQPSKKWFVQAELKYKAPQYIQEQLYRESVQDLPFDYTTTTYVIKKVYYNQVPLSFDYYIIPHLSIGVGVIYNNYAGQVSQQDIRKKLYGTTADSVISSRIISDRNDSNFITFTKNSFQGLIEGQYDWRRFSIGARYAIGLQPYLKYNTDQINNGISPAPSNNVVEKKNDALTIFIRYELWDSRGKKKK